MITELIDPNAEAKTPELITITEKTIEETVAKYSGLKIDGIDDKEGFAAVKRARLACRDIRTTIEDERLNAGRFFRDKIKKVDAAAEKLQSKINPTEQRLKKMEDAVEAEKEAIEKQRLDIREHIRKSKIEELGGFMFPENIRDWTDEAFADLLVRTAEYHRQRREKAEADAKLAAEQKAEADRLAEIAAEQKRISDELAEKQRKIDEQQAKIDAENKRIDELNAKAEKDKADAAAENERLERESVERASVSPYRGNVGTSWRFQEPEKKAAATEVVTFELKTDLELIGSYLEELNQLGSLKLSDANFFEQRLVETQFKTLVTVIESVQARLQSKQ